MNLKHQFYRAYYQDLDLRKFTDRQVQEHHAGQMQQRIQEGNQHGLARAAARLFDNVQLNDLQTDAVLQGAWGEDFQTIALQTTYPGLLIGSGYTHETGNEGEFKLGFYFDHTTGLPILPGHSVKGVLRSAFPGLGRPNQGARNREEQQAKVEWLSGLLGWQKTVAEATPLIDGLERVLFEGVPFGAAQAGPSAPESLPMGRRAVFLDAVVAGLAGQRGNEGKLLGPDALTPHGTDPLKNPIPLPFVKVLPGITFRFRFRLPPVQLGAEQLSGRQVGQLFRQILRTLGVGAKTNVGYGHLVEPVSSSGTAAGSQSKPAARTTGSAPAAREAPVVPPVSPTPPRATLPSAVKAYYKAAPVRTDQVYFAYILGPHPRKENKTQIQLLVEGLPDEQCRRNLPARPEYQAGEVWEVKLTLDTRNGYPAEVKPVQRVYPKEK